jgi:hypothetical protein
MMLFFQAVIMAIFENQLTTNNIHSFSCLVDGRPYMKSIEMDSQGLSRVGREVYKP